LKTSQQLLDEITAAMADVWLAACERRVIASCLDKFVVLDTQKTGAEAPFGVFGPASTTECQTFVHRAAALDVLRMLGTERVAKASFAAANGELHAV
jgi:hypothetical protein